MRIVITITSRSALCTAAIAAAGLTFLSAGCAATEPSGATDVRVVATTPMLGDVVSRVTDCAGGTTTTLIAAGTDPHEFSASSQDLVDMAQADLVVANGLGLEEGLADTMENLETDGVAVLEVARLVDPIPLQESHEGEGAAEEESDDPQHEQGSEDPHVWHDPARMAEAIGLVSGELARRTGNSDYTRCGQEEQQRLSDLESQVRIILAPVPVERRVLVTDHDAFGYLAATYDFEVAGTVVPSPSTLAEPSSSDLADLVSVVRSTGVPVIFSNSASNPALIESLAAEAGAEISVEELYVDSLGPQGSGAETYAGMMTTNAQRIAEALGGGEDSTS